MTGEIFRELAEEIRADRPAALVTVVRGPANGTKLLVTQKGARGSLGSAELDRVVGADAASMLELGITGMRSYG